MAYGIVKTPPNASTDTSAGREPGERRAGHATLAAVLVAAIPGVMTGAAPRVMHA